MEPHSPRFAHALQRLVDTSKVWAEHVKASGSRIDTQAKVDASLRFCLSPEYAQTFGDEAHLTFSLPTNLAGTSKHQVVLSRIYSTYSEGRRLYPKIENGQIAVYVQGIETLGEPSGTRLVGYIKDKHTAWLTPLVATGQIRTHIKEITGIDRGHTAGVNIVITDLALALAAPKPAEKDETLVLLSTALHPHSDYQRGHTRAIYRDRENGEYVGICVVGNEELFRVRADTRWHAGDYIRDELRRMKEATHQHAQAA